MIFRQLFDPESSTYTYLIADERSRKAAIVDPVLEQLERDSALVEELGLSLRYVLDTHVHADHVTAADALRARFGATTAAGAANVECADLTLRHGDVLLLGDVRIEVLATPGHTDNSVSYRVGDKVLTGDALFIRGCGRTDFQNGDAATLYDSITRVLFALPDDTEVYPAHDYKGHTMSTIGEEKRLNPRVAGKSEAEFVELMGALNLPRPKKIDVAVPRNLQCGRRRELQEVPA